MKVEEVPVVECSNQKPLTVDSVIRWQLPLLLVLFSMVVFVGIKTVVHRHEARASYMELQKFEKERDRLAAQWSRLKLEQGTALNQVRVEQYARWDLGMKLPKASEIQMVREVSNKMTADYSSSRQKSLPVVLGSTSKVVLGD